MTSDDIIKLAREVGAPVGVMALGRHDGVLFTPYELEHFVALVAAAEREACLEIADQCADADMHSSMAANAIRARGRQ